MSRKESDVDIETLLKVLELTQKAEKKNNEEKPEGSVWTIKGVTLVSIIPVIIAIGSLIYKTGVQKEGLASDITNSRHELRAEMIEKLSNYKDDTNGEMRRLQEDIRKALQQNNNLVIKIDRLEEEVAELQASDRTMRSDIDNNYRTTTWLRSQQNADIPPPRQ